MRRGGPATWPPTEEIKRQGDALIAPARSRLIIGEWNAPPIFEMMKVLEVLYLFTNRNDLREK